MFTWLKRLGLPALALFALLGLAGCGGGDAGTAEEGATGVVNIMLTDAEGDFVTYTVDVTSLTLTRADGAIVETLPVTTRVDFARYTDLTEFLTAATVPSGVYKHATITLDYTDADIQVEDAAGNAVAVQTFLDSDGNPVTTLTLDVRLEGVRALPIVPGLPRLLSLDFDLEKSHTVDLAGTPSITIAPVLYAEVDRESDKPQRLRGPLQSVNEARGTFHLFIHPFHARLDRGARPFGSVTVHTDETTHFEIDGQAYTGADGLAVLALEPRFTGVIVRGVFRLRPRRFEATEVYAGTSVPGGEMDAAVGSVVARTADTLTLRGVTLQRRDGVVVFHDTVTVTVADSTLVRKALHTGEFTQQDISVGQRLIVFGTLTRTDITDLRLDASNGYARMLVSNLRGQVVANDPVAGRFDLSLHAINGRNPALYDFTGTGRSPAEDADPANYELNTGTLDTSAFTVGENVAARGFVTPFGSAPKDFDAITLVRRPGLIVLPPPPGDAPPGPPVVIIEP